MSLDAASISLSKAENLMNLSQRTWKISKTIAGGLLEAPLGRPHNQNRLGRASVKEVDKICTPWPMYVIVMATITTLCMKMFV